LPVKSFYYYYY